MDSENKFTYKYSPAEKEEAESIRKIYDTKSNEPTKLEQLRKVHKNVIKSAEIAALTVGITGILIFGTGLSFVLVWGENLMLAGIALGIAGAAIAAAAYPVYTKVIKKKKEKYAPIIQTLAYEITNM